MRQLDLSDNGRRLGWAADLTACTVNLYEYLRAQIFRRKHVKNTKYGRICVGERDFPPDALEILQ